MSSCHCHLIRPSGSVSIKSGYSNFLKISPRSCSSVHDVVWTKIQFFKLSRASLSAISRHLAPGAQSCVYWGKCIFVSSQTLFQWKREEHAHSYGWTKFKKSGFMQLFTAILVQCYMSNGIVILNIFLEIEDGNIRGFLCHSIKLNNQPIKLLHKAVLHNCEFISPRDN